MAEGKLQMRITGFPFEGKQVTVGVLRRFNEKERVPLLDVPGLVRAVNAEHGTNLRLMRPHVANFLLHKTENWQEVREGFPSPLDVGIGYEKPGVKLGKEIVYSPGDGTRVILPTGKYKGKMGVALAVLDLTADDIKKDGNDTRIDVPGRRLVVVPEFPSEDGCYLQHPETTIPHGKMVDGFPDVRYLLRVKGSSYVGLLVRDAVEDGRDVYAECGPSRKFGVVVEIPREDKKELHCTPEECKEVLGRADASITKLKNSETISHEQLEALRRLLDVLR